MQLLDFWFEMSLQRRKRLVLFLVLILVVAGTFLAARSVLGTYLIGALLAYTLAPFVDWVQRGLQWLSQRAGWLKFLHKRARGWSIMFSYLLFLAVIAGGIALVIPVILEQAQSLWDGRDELWVGISQLGENLIAQYHLLPDQIQQPLEEALLSLGAYVTEVLQQALQGTVVAITYTTSLVLAIFVIPFWTFYLLRDFSTLRTTTIKWIPSAVREDVINIVRLLDHILGAYLRGQIFLCLIVGSLTALILSMLGLEFALLFGVLAGILEVIPNIGPTLAAIPAILLALTHNLPLALMTTGASILIQQVENIFLVPRILGDSVGLHPVLLMVMLVVGVEIAGLPGLFMAPIMAAMVRDLYKYFYHRCADVPLAPEAALDAVYKETDFDVQI